MFLTSQAFIYFKVFMEQQKYFYILKEDEEYVGGREGF